MFQKPTGKVKMVGVETQEGLFEGILRKGMAEQAHLSRSEVKDLWHQRLGHVSSDNIRASLPHVKGEEKDSHDSKETEEVGILRRKVGGEAIG